MNAKESQKQCVTALKKCIHIEANKKQRSHWEGIVKDPNWMEHLIANRQMFWKYSQVQSTFYFLLKQIVYSKKYFK